VGNQEKQNPEKPLADAAGVSQKKVVNLVLTGLDTYIERDAKRLDSNNISEQEFDKISEDLKTNTKNRLTNFPDASRKFSRLSLDTKIDFNAAIGGHRCGNVFVRPVAERYGRTAKQIHDTNYKDYKRFENDSNLNLGQIYRVPIFINGVLFQYQKFSPGPTAAGLFAPFNFENESPEMQAAARRFLRWAIKDDFYWGNKSQEVPGNKTAREIKKQHVDNLILSLEDVKKYTIREGKKQMSDAEIEDSIKYINDHRELIYDLYPYEVGRIFDSTPSNIIRVTDGNVEPTKENLREILLKTKHEDILHVDQRERHGFKFIEDVTNKTDARVFSKVPAILYPWLRAEHRREVHNIYLKKRNKLETKFAPAQMVAASRDWRLGGYILKPYIGGLFATRSTRSKEEFDENLSTYEANRFHRYKEAQSRMQNVIGPRKIGYAHKEVATKLSEIMSRIPYQTGYKFN